MTSWDAVIAFAESVNERNNGLFFPHIAEDCVYISRGYERARGKECICAILKEVSDYWAAKYVHAWPAVITSGKLPDFPDGTSCAVIATTDEYSCAGFFVMDTDAEGKVKKINFSIDPYVWFKIEGMKDAAFSHDHFPRDSWDAVVIRAEGKGIIEGTSGLDDEGRMLFYNSLSIGKYINGGHRFANGLLTYIGEKVRDGLEQKIKNAAGYIFIKGMTDAFDRNLGFSLFYLGYEAIEEDACPKVWWMYQEWIGEGYETGKDLLNAFWEYKANRRFDDLVYDDELMHAYSGIYFAGCLKAEEDLHKGIPEKLAILRSSRKLLIKNAESENRENLGEPLYENKSIRRITMESLSYDGYFSDRLVITKESIRYEYCPICGPKDKSAWDWSFSTDDKDYRDAFQKMEPLVAAALNEKDIDSWGYFGIADLMISYEDGTSARRDFSCKTEAFSTLIYAMLDLMNINNMPEIIYVMLYEWAK